MYKDLKESSAIQTHINILQNVINRMAGNSANSKTWAITIILAIRGLKTSKLVSFLYKLARVTNDLSKVASGNPKKIAKRVKNKYIGKRIGKRIFK